MKNSFDFGDLDLIFKVIVVEKLKIIFQGWHHYWLETFLSAQYLVNQ